MLKITDVTDYVLALQAATLEQTKQAFKYLEVAPAPNIAEYCDAKLDCRFIRHHFTEIPEYNVTHISRINADKCLDLLTQGIIDIRHVPADFKLSDKQRRQVEIACGTEAHIEREAIRAELDALQYPLNFLDYEAFSYAVPHFEGIRPYQQMLFQYSLHTITEPGAEPTHHFHLSRAQVPGSSSIQNPTSQIQNGAHPAKEIADALHRDLSAGIGTVIVWSKGFEKMCNSQLGELYPEFCEFLAAINDSIYDLSTIFSKGLYLHPGFRGRHSIKTILPVLCPEHSYGALDIGDGTTAAIKWYHMATRRFDDEECERIYEALCKYCHLDTQAMVSIYECLKRECAELG